MEKKRLYLKLQREKEFFKVNTFKPETNSKFFINSQIKDNKKGFNNKLGKSNSFTFNYRFYSSKKDKNKKNETVMASLLLEENSLSNRSSYNASFISRDNNLLKYISEEKKVNNSSFSNKNRERTYNNQLNSQGMNHIKNKLINIKSNTINKKKNHNKDHYNYSTTKENFSKSRDHLIDTLEKNKLKIFQLLSNNNNNNSDEAVTKIVEDLILSEIMIEKEKYNSELKKSEIQGIISNFISKLKITTTLDYNDSSKRDKSSMVYTDKKLSKNIVSLYSKSKEKLKKLQQKQKIYNTNNEENLINESENYNRNELIHVNKNNKNKSNFKNKEEVVDYILKRKLQQINQKLSNDI